jgi:hypothetical protein
VLAGIHEWLRPGGTFAATLGTSDSPEDLEDFFGTSMSFSHFDTPTNRHLLAEAGFRVEQADEIFDEGETSLWVVATA